MSEEPNETPPQPEVLTRIDSGEGTSTRSIPPVVVEAVVGLTTGVAGAYVKQGIDAVVQKVHDHNAPEVIHLPPTESESQGSE